MRDDVKNRLKARRKLKTKLGMLMLSVTFVITAGTTGAWYQSKSDVTNTFNAGSFKTTIAENFSPPDNWFPGVTTDKVVQVTNTGTLDAYTRIELQPTLVFYTKTGDRLSVNELNADEPDSGESDSSETTYDSVSQMHFATVNKNAVESVAMLGGYTRIKSEDLTGDYLALSGVLDIPENVTLFAKVDSTSNVDENGGITTEYTYSFVGYYRVDDKYYEISVDKNADNDYQIYLYPTQKNKYEYNKSNGKEVIDKAITLYFCDESGNNSEELPNYWVKHTVTTEYGGEVMYFYYKDKLKSGTTTKPLLNAVKLNDDFIYDIYEASFDLNVVSLSSQAYKEAAETVFGATDGKFNSDILSEVLNE